MGNSLYARNETAWCPSCIAKGFHFRMNDSRHFSLHVPRDRWPASMQEPRKERVVVDGLVLAVTDPRAQSEYEAARTYVCECGEWSGDSPQGFAAHKRRAKQHQVAA